jgi:hypothetical protein
MNLTTYLSAKPNKFVLTKPQLNLIAKLDDMGVTIDPSVITVVNPMTGYFANVDPLIVVLINWVYDTYKSYHNGSMNYRGTKIAIGTFDRVRHLILDLDKESFRNFID